VCRNPASPSTAVELRRRVTSTVTGQDVELTARGAAGTLAEG